MICPQCGTNVNDGAQFCSACGAKLAKPSAPKFCALCGNPLDPDALYCDSCGAKVSDMTEPQAAPAAPAAAPAYVQAPAQPVQPSHSAGNAGQRYGIPVPGYSDRVNDPEIAKTIKVQKGIAKKWLFIMPVFPLAGFPLYAMFSGKMQLKEAVYGGVFVALVFFIVGVISIIKSRPSNTYEASVIKKKKTSGDEGKDDQYITIARTTEGKKKKIIETYPRYAWDYMEVGDRFKYHPQFAFPYELYDKTRTDRLYCPGCAHANSVEEDRCVNCGLPLLK